MHGAIYSVTTGEGSVRCFLAISGMNGDAALFSLCPSSSEIRLLDVCERTLNGSPGVEDRYGNFWAAKGCGISKPLPVSVSALSGTHVYMVLLHFRRLYDPSRPSKPSFMTTAPTTTVSLEHGIRGRGCHDQLCRTGLLCKKNTACWSFWWLISRTALFVRSDFHVNDDGIEHAACALISVLLELGLVQ